MTGKTMEELAEEGERWLNALAHRAVEETVPSRGTAAGDPTHGARSMNPGRSDGKFDESKVKRDGKGRFSTTNSAKGPDEEWMPEDNIKEIQIKVSLEALDKFAPEMRAEMIAQGIDVEKEGWDSFDSYTPSRELTDKVYDHIDAELSKPEYVSPSGTKKIQAIRYYTKASEDSDRPQYKIVSTSARHGALEEEILLYDGLTIGEYLEHFGVRGMRWGVRRTPEQLAASKQSLMEKRADLRTARSAAATKSSSALAKQSKLQTKAMQRVTTGKKVGTIQRWNLRRANRKTVKSLKQVRKIERKDRRAEKKISKLDQQIVDAGKRMAEEMLQKKSG